MKQLDVVRCHHKVKWPWWWWWSDSLCALGKNISCEIFAPMMFYYYFDMVQRYIDDGGGGVSVSSSECVDHQWLMHYFSCLLVRSTSSFSSCWFRLSVRSLIHDSSRAPPRHPLYINKGHIHIGLISHKELKTEKDRDTEHNHARFEKLLIELLPQKNRYTNRDYPRFKKKKKKLQNRREVTD